MHRLGFLPDEIPALVEILKQQEALTPRSIFSHFAGSDSPLFDEFSKQQYSLFNKAANTLQQAFNHKILRHICNSAGAERFAEAREDMVRLGIGLYGLSFVHATLRNVCTLKTTILSIKTVPANATIGYGRHTTLSEPRQIAVIPIGYADGFDRRFSNYGGEVLVRGKRCPVVGNVCMDQAMIDVTGTDAQPGDYAIVFGDQLPLQELADKLHTIPYEVLTSISRRVQRLYFYE
jgi:alanine racemase